MPESLRHAVRALALEAFDPTCRRLPAAAAASLVGRTLRGRSVALCLHRVGARRRSFDPLPEQTIPPETLDAFLDIVRAARRGGGGPARLTLAFDDGYQDAVDYVLSRAPRHPEVEWLVFLCPEKLLTRAAFRWDLWEAHPDTRLRPIRLEALEDGLDPALENRRPELRALGDLPEHRLADLDDCRRLLALPNVTVGNHTNAHLRLAALPPDVARAEILRSMETFADLFGPCTHFAFPFGVPGRDYRACDVTAVRDAAPGAVLWTTEPRPYVEAERIPGAVLPRVPTPGRWSARTLSVWLARLGRRHRADGATRTAAAGA
jgi:hypothetical protein